MIDCRDCFSVTNRKQNASFFIWKIHLGGLCSSSSSSFIVNFYTKESIGCFPISHGETYKSAQAQQIRQDISEY